MRGGAFLNGKEGRVGFRKKSPKYFKEKILLVFKRAFKIFQHLMFRILFRKISMFRRNAPVNAKRFIQDRDTPISLWVIEVITLPFTHLTNLLWVDTRITLSMLVFRRTRFAPISQIINHIILILQVFNSIFYEEFFQE